MTRRFIFISLAFWSACGGGSSGSTCPNDLPASCMMPRPSYQNDVSAIFANRCTACHSPTGLEPTRLLTDYSDVYALRTEILTQVYGCLMPPQGAIPPSRSERAQLLDWLVCGAPNN